MNETFERKITFRVSGENFLIQISNEQPNNHLLLEYNAVIFECINSASER